MRHPLGLLAGLMWFDPDREDCLVNIRHLAQERDGKPHAWTFYAMHQHQFPKQTSVSAVALNVAYI